MNTKNKNTTKISEDDYADASQFLDAWVGPLTMHSLLEAARLADDLSHAQFARNLGISRANLCDIEKGRKLLSCERAATFARTLGKSEALWIQIALQDELRASGLHFLVHIKKSVTRIPSKKMRSQTHHTRFSQTH